GRVVLRARRRVHCLRWRDALVAPGRLVRVRAQGRAAHLHGGDRRSESPDRLSTVPVRGLPARGRRTGGRAGAAATAPGSPGHGATTPDRRAQRDGDPRTSRAAPRALGESTRPERACARSRDRAGSPDTGGTVNVTLT